MTPFEVYMTFVSLKNHFTKSTYDVFKYNWKTRTSVASFDKRKDKYFFERLSRKKSEQEVKEFFVSNFVDASTPEAVYVPEIIRTGEEIYINWKRRIQSLSYLFETEISIFIQKENFDNFFLCKTGVHSELIRKYLQNAISLETLVILDCILNYTKKYDKILDDPIWEMLSMRIRKYKPFLDINSEKYLKILKDTVI